MSKQTTETIEGPKPVEMTEEITQRLLTEALKSLNDLSNHYKHLNSINQYHVNKCLHILWKL